MIIKPTPSQHWPLAALLTLTLAAGSAQAHHPVGGVAPGTLAQGLLSGLGHPVIGLDHLLFVLAVGVWGALADAGRLRCAFCFVVMSLAGTLLHAARVDLPLNEAWVAGTLLAAAAALLWQRVLPMAGVLAFLAIAGAVHGYAYGEAVVGAEATPLLAYLVGLCIVQLGLTAGVAALTRRVQARATWLVRKARTALAALVALTGILGLQAVLWG